MARVRLHLAENIAAAKVPLITLNEERFRFNSVFVRTSGIDSTWKVHIEVDEDEFKIWFVFTKSPKEFAGALKLISQEGKTALTASSVKVVRMFDWIKKVVEQSGDNRRFSPIQSQNKNEWYISLIPAFENQVKRADVKKK